MKYSLIVSIILFSATTLAKDAIPSKDLLTRLHDADQEEISLAKLAQEKAESPKVKQYGMHIIKDHEKADKKVVALAKEEGIDLNTSMPSSLGEAGQATKGDAKVEELKMMSGAKFDREFVSTMDAGHADIIKLLQTSKIDDPKAAALSKQLLPTLKEHRRMAQNLEPLTKTE